MSATLAWPTDIARARELESAGLTLELAPDWDTISAVWDVCRTHLELHVLDPAVVYALCMVVQELLENAVKYGGFRCRSERISLELSTSDGRHTIEVRTPVPEDEALLRRLEATVQWIRSFQSPFEAYLERLDSIRRGGTHDAESGLGLVRIAYEANCLVDFYVDAADRVAICAIYPSEYGRLS